MGDDKDKNKNINQKINSKWRLLVFNHCPFFLKRYALCIWRKFF